VGGKRILDAVPVNALIPCFTTFDQFDKGKGKSGPTDLMLVVEGGEMGLYSFDSGEDGEKLVKVCGISNGGPTPTLSSPVLNRFTINNSTRVQFSLRLSFHGGSGSSSSPNLSLTECLIDCVERALRRVEGKGRGSPIYGLRVAVLNMRSLGAEKGADGAGWFGERASERASLVTQ